MKAMRTHTASNINNGFTYIGLLLFIAITGVGLSVAGMSWQYQVRAEKEKQLLFVGAEFRNAINSYYASSPDAAKVYPATLNDLLLDKRMPNIKRHLRKIYLDPMTGKADWGFATQQGRIVGIYSRSILAPYKQKGFNVAEEALVGAKTYKDWIFGRNGIVEQKTMVNSSSLSNPVSPSPMTSAESNLANNSKSGVKQEVLDRQSASSNSGAEVSSDGSSSSSRLDKLDYYKKNGVVPPDSYYLNNAQ
jgi:type II secretory pathway pseudopilin PulG